MNKQIAAIAAHFGAKNYTIEGYCGIIDGLRLKLARYEESKLIFKYPQKQNPFKEKIAAHQNAILNTIDGLFAFDKKTFLSKYSITHYIAVDKNDNEQVMFYTTYTKKKKEEFKLDIKVFGKEQFYEVDFTVISCGDKFYISSVDSKSFVNLKEFFMIKNCRYDIKQMFGTLDDFNSELVDMCFI